MKNQKEKEAYMEGAEAFKEMLLETSTVMLSAHIKTVFEVFKQSQKGKSED